ncbi:hypothetical protein HKD37_04G010146 [Glycine soja]
MPTQIPTLFSPPPTTTGGHHKPLFLVIKPPHQEKCFNQSGILRIHLKDSVEKNPSIISFVASLRKLTFKPFSWLV